MRLKNPIGTGPASKIAKMSQQLFTYYIKAGLGPDYQKIGRYYIFEKEDVINWVKPPDKRIGHRGE